jgi:MFS family permease
VTDPQNPGLAGDQATPDAAVTPERAGVFGRTFSSLQVRNFRLFFFGQLISNSGNWLTTVALTLLVLQRSGSGSAVGLLAVAQYGPLLFLSAWAGVVIDRVNKRHLLYVTQTLEMLESLTLATLAFLPHVPLPAFYGVAFAGGCMLAFDNPGRRSFVSEMVDAPRVPNAVTLYSSMVNLSRIIGPAIAGLLVISVGFGWCFAVDGASYIVVIGALIAMRGSELHRVKATPRARGQVRAGFKYILGVHELWVSFLMLLIIGILTYNFTVLFPLYVEKGLHGSATDYTWLYSIFSIGAVAGSLLVARRTSVTLRTVLLGSVALGVSMLVLFFMPSVDWAFPVIAFVGVASVAYQTPTTTLSQLRADPQMVGRVIAIQTVLQLGTTPIGGPLIGYITDATNGRIPVLVGAVAALAASLIGLIAGRRYLTRVPRPEPTDPTPAAV